jgi:hypothetical protein
VPYGSVYEPPDTWLASDGKLHKRHVAKARALESNLNSICSIRYASSKPIHVLKQNTDYGSEIDPTSIASSTALLAALIANALQPPPSLEPSRIREKYYT